MLCVTSVESRVPADHPLRGIKTLAEAASRQLSPLRVGYGISRTIRMRIEQDFGWAKSIGELRRTRFRGKRRTRLAVYMVGAAYNLLRPSKLRRAAA
jgi:hypothetical protein